MIMEIIVALRNFLNAPEFAPQFVAKQSRALMSMENVLVYVLLHAEKNIVNTSQKSDWV